MIAQRNHMARFRSDFFRDLYRKFLWALLFNVVIILGLTLAITYIVLFQPSTSYYASTTEGLIVPMVPQS